jgi:type II secretory pathway pseudopilin PulG
LTLIELALVLSLTGALLAAFLPTFFRHLSTSKIAEAVEQLDALHRATASYYAAHRACLPASAGPYPALPSADPVQVDFAHDERGAATWSALGREAAPLRFGYQLEVLEPGCTQRAAGPALYLRAFGDLDGDGVTSLFERAARVEHGALVPQGPLRTINRVE